MSILYRNRKKWYRSITKVWCKLVMRRKLLSKLRTFTGKPHDVTAYDVITFAKRCKLWSPTNSKTSSAKVTNILVCQDRCYYYLQVHFSDNQQHPAALCSFLTNYKLCRIANCDVIAHFVLLHEEWQFKSFSINFFTNTSGFRKTSKVSQPPNLKKIRTYVASLVLLRF